MRDNTRTVRRPSWAAVFVLAAGAWPSLAAAAEPLRSIAEILALPQDELHTRRPVVVRGVVTVLVPLLIQDGEFGIRVNPPEGDPGQPSLEQLAGLPLELGAEVEVTGAVGPGRYKPEILMHSFRRLGTRPLPEPEPLELSQFFAGGYVGRRVRAKGVVQAVFDNPEGWSMVVESAARRFRVVVNKHLIPSPPDAWIDAEVEIVGTGYAYRNSRGEFLSPGLVVARAEDVRVVLAPVLGAFELPMTPLNAIARFRSKPLGGHRLRTSGIVSFGVPGLLYVQEGIGGVRVELAPTPGTEQLFQAGDRIEMAGFPDVTTGIGTLLWAVARKISAGPVPVPVDIQPSEIQRLDAAIMRAAEIANEGSHDGCLIRCRGRIEAVYRSDAGIVLYLLDQRIGFMVTFADERGPNREPFVIGSDVEVTGVVQTLRSLPHAGDVMRGAGRIAQIELLLRGADDIRVVRLPPWWTPRRLVAAAAAAAALAISGFFWVTILHREVARQTARAVAEESARFKSAVDYEITLRERNRLAANLHDTILQTVTGIAFQLKVCEAHGRRRDDIDGVAPAGGDDGIERHLMVARKMVDHAAEQLRGTVWSLRSLPTDGHSLVTGLEELCDRLGAGHAARISLRVDPEAEATAAHVAGNLLLVVQEAVHNALHHASPAAIDVRVDAADAGAIDVEVSDDGSGFEMGTQAGPRQGHFGLVGIRERVDGLGGTLVIDSAPGRGTRVRIHVPVTACVGRSAAIMHS